MKQLKIYLKLALPSKFPVLFLNIRSSIIAKYRLPLGVGICLRFQGSYCCKATMQSAKAITARRSCQVRFRE